VLLVELGKIKYKLLSHCLVISTERLWFACNLCRYTNPFRFVIYLFSVR